MSTQVPCDSWYGLVVWGCAVGAEIRVLDWTAVALALLGVGRLWVGLLLSRHCLDGEGVSRNRELLESIKAGVEKD